MHARIMNKKRIYIADDDPSILEVISIILGSRGYDVITSPDGISLDTLEVLPDLIFLDIRMSGTDGGEICRHFKSQPHKSQVPVVLISANRDIDEIAQKCGADDFLPKPFEIKDIVSLAGKYTNKN